VTRATTLVLIDPAIETTSPLADRLRMQGHVVSIARDPADGARMALAEPPSALIADLWMPSISGVQLCRLLNAEPATEHVPVILRGPDSARDRFWAERAGASEYVVKGRMGDLVRALGRAIQSRPADDEDGFFTTFAGQDIRERIAAHLDAALFESVLAAEVRALGTCGAFDRLFDLFSQFVSRVATYRWLAVSTNQPLRLGLHTNSRGRASAEREARSALGFGQDCLVELVEDDDACDAPPGGAPIIKPIELGGIRIGTLALSLARSVTPEDDQLALIIAREIAGPIRMATLVEESQRLATVDALTGLMNRRAVTNALQVEIERSRRYGHALCLALLDVDHFKMINDRRGHGTGDTVLSALGRHLSASVRKTDVAARWGGEEFVIALTSSALSGATIFAERLRGTIEALEVVDSEGARVPITVSIGLAEYQHGDSLDALVDRADRAMYQAKSTGRNRVAVADPTVAHDSEPVPSNLGEADARQRLPA
jgi:two-component system cell cycle response regulator